MQIKGAQTTNRAPHRVAYLSHRAWLRRGADPHVRRCARRGSIDDALQVPRGWLLASVMAVTDVYLCLFKKSEDSPLLEAMGAGRPCVAVRHPSDPARNTAAEILGVPELIADNDVGYLQVAQGLLRDAKVRARCSDLVLSRFQAEFSSAHLGRRYLEFLSKIRQGD